MMSGMSAQRATNEEVIAAYRETGSVWRAGERLGISGGSVYERLRHLDFPIAKSNWTDAEVKAAVELATAAIPISQISARLGRTYAGVAAKLSECGIKHGPRSLLHKVKRGKGLTKPVILAVAKHLLQTGVTVSKAAKMYRLSTTGLVNALQVKAPELWAEYVQRHSILSSKECPGCGGTFTPLSYRQLYCTTQCGGHARTDATYFGGKRRTAIGLVEGICQLCNKHKPAGLAAHHVLGKENDPDNKLLIALCLGCHQLVGILGRRSDGDSPEFWQNLISLAVARAWADKGRNAAGAYVEVAIEELNESEISEVLP